MNIFYGIEIELLLGVNCRVSKHKLNYITIYFYDKNSMLIGNIELPPECIIKKKNKYFIEIKNVQNYKLTQKIIELLEKLFKKKVENLKNITIDNSIRIFPNEFGDENLFIIPCEIISRKLNYKELEFFIEDVLNLSKYVNISYNDTCGVHISYSIPSLEIKNKIRVIDGIVIPNFKLLNFILGNKIDLLNRNIRNNKDEYSVSTEKIIKKIIDDFKLKKYNYNYNILNIIRGINKEKFSKKVLDLINLIYLKIYNNKKYHIINVRDFLTNNGRVEIRMFTTFYLFEKKELVLKILKYIVQKYIKYNTSYIEKKRVDNNARQRIKEILQNVKF